MSQTKDDKIWPGQNVAVYASFRDPETNGLIDPGIVSFIFRRPNGTEELGVTTRMSQGKYRGEIVADVSGEWSWRTVSEAPGQAAKEDDFRVEKSRFT